MVALTGIALGFVASRSASADEPDVETPPEVRELANDTLMPRSRSSGHVARVAAFRRELAELRLALDEVEAEGPMADLDRTWEHRNRTRMRHAELVTRRGRDPKRPLEARFDELWSEVDYLLADPVGQRARIPGARRLIGEALAGKPQQRSLGLVIRLPQPESIAPPPREEPPSGRASRRERAMRR